MIRLHSTVLLALCAMCVAPACERATPADPAPPKAHAQTHADPPAPPKPAQDPNPQNPTPKTDDACAPWVELNGMDTRKPVPLQPMMAWHQKQNMMEHLVAVEKIIGALARDDWSEAERASTTIGSSPQMKMMCEHMGAGAEGFTQLALEFHTRADGIAEAVRKRDKNKALQATSHTLQACTTCHATFRQDVVSAQTWKARTGSSHEPTSHPASSPSSAPAKGP